MWANLRGMDSHGVLRVPRYTEYMKNGNIHARPDIKLEKRAGAIAILVIHTQVIGITTRNCVDTITCNRRNIGRRGKGNGCLTR